MERELQGVPFERRFVKRVAGVEVQPLYTAQSPLGVRPYRRGSNAVGTSALGWRIGQDLVQREPSAAAAAAADAVIGGVTHLTLRCEGGSRGTQAGIRLEHIGDIATVLAQVPLSSTAVSFGGSPSLAHAAALVAHAQQRGAMAELEGCLGLDPLGSWAAQGELSGSLETALAQAADAACWVRRHCPKLQVLSVNAGVYQEAAADAALELGMTLATGIEYLRALTGAGLSLADASASLRFEFGIGTDVFAEIAKLRAARLGWSRAVAVAGGDDTAQRCCIHARGSRRAQTRRDAWGNLLRGASESFSAVTGGADVVTTLELGDALGQSDARSQRLARNTQLLLWHEAHLGRVRDPAGGSYYVEALTGALCLEAWKHFQVIEREGGLAASLSKGALQGRLSTARRAARQAVETRRTLIVGVSEYAPDRDELPFARTATSLDPTPPSSSPAEIQVDRERPFASALAAALQGAALRGIDRALSHGAPARCTSLVCERLAEPFEALRERADELARRNATPPTAFLVNLGPASEHGARANFALGYLRAGGFEVLTNDGFAAPEPAAHAFAQSGAHIAVLCSSDELYARLAEPAARALAAYAPRAVVLAGQPGALASAYRAAGITDFIYLGNNAVESLSALLARVEAT